MSIFEGFFEFMTNSLPGAIIDTAMGRGGDGNPDWPLSSAESYVTPEQGAQPVININAAVVNQQVGAVNTAQETAAAVPQPEPAPTEETMMNSWANAAEFYTVPDESQQAAQEQAFYAARQDEELARGHGRSM